MDAVPSSVWGSEGQGPWEQVDVHALLCTGSDRAPSHFTDNLQWIKKGLLLWLYTILQDWREG
jgi:hypothetical protein